MVKKQLIVVAYDICNNRRRKKLSDLLQEYGIRVNYSVFECLLTGIQLRKLKTQIEPLINVRHDSVLYYTLCASCIEKIERQGLSHPLFAPTHIV